MANLRGVIKTFKTDDYTVTRKSSGSYINGRYYTATASTLEIEASIQPAGGRDMKALPEAYHSDELKVIYTKTRLYPRTPSQAPDTIEIEGETYEVIKVEKWDAFSDTHYVAYASLIPAPIEQEVQMQGNQEQSFQFIAPSDSDSYLVTIPIAMIDTTYVVQMTISYVPPGGALALLEASNTGRTQTQFTLLCSGPLKTGTIIDVVVRDRA